MVIQRILAFVSNATKDVSNSRPLSYNEPYEPGSELLLLELGVSSVDDVVAVIQPVSMKFKLRNIGC